VSERFRSHPLTPGFVVEAGLPWHPPAALLPEIEALWGRATSNPETQLTNGELFVLAAIGPERLTIRPSEYRYAVARRMQPALVARGLEVRPIAVTGVVCCADGVLLGHRSSWVANDSGLWEPFPSGGLDRPDPVGQIHTEFEEELGLGAETIARIDCRGVIEDLETGICDIVFRIEVSAQKSEIVTAHGSIEMPEHDVICVMPPNQLNAFVEQHREEVLPVLEPMLSMVGLLHR
jgi:hypothetical protein